MQNQQRTVPFFCKSHLERPMWCYVSQIYQSTQKTNLSCWKDKKKVERAMWIKKRIWLVKSWATCILGRREKAEREESRGKGTGHAWSIHPGLGSLALRSSQIITLMLPTQFSKCFISIIIFAPFRGIFRYEIEVYCFSDYTDKLPHRSQVMCQPRTCVCTKWQTRT